MPLPELIGKETTDPMAACGLVDRWQICEELANRLIYLADSFPYPLEIISGYRSPDHQAALRAEPDSMAAPVDRSTHTTCPATGADLWFGVRKEDTAKQWPIIRMFGMHVESVGLRWGGGSPRDDMGIPSDWNHVDLGPRTS